MKKQNQLLKFYSITLSFVLGLLILSGFRSENSKEKFDEITVQRINVVEPDGKLKMVISNQALQHPGMFDGKVLVSRERPPGIIFFNEEQDEVGGLIYQGSKEQGATFVFSIDQYKNDQVMQMRHITNREGDNKYGLQLWQRDKEFTLPRFMQVFDSLKALHLTQQEISGKLTELNNGKAISAPRLFIGKGFNKEAGLFIQDEQGKDRLRIYVDGKNQPRMEVLDDKGNVIKDLASEKDSENKNSPR